MNYITKSIFDNKIWVFKIIIYAVFVVLISNISAIVDYFIHPQIPYFDKEHLIIGATTLIFSLIFGAFILIYINRLQIINIERRKLLKELLQAKENAEESESKLKERNATKDKLFSIIAHDLRSPFNNIIGLSELLIGNEKESHAAQSEKYAALINSSATNTLILLDNLLNWAKSQTGQLSFNPKKIILSSLITEVVKTSNSIALLKNISLNIIQDKEVKVYTDENMVMIILRNLISNAIKYTNPGGEINVNVIPGAKQVEISISDNGVGMDEEKIKTLFNISSNATSPGTAKEKGSGLGLVLCKEFVEKLDGKIWVESKEGKGSNFKFTLPLNS
ncbi:MAG: hypothetical protein APF83_04805 [Lutibacter sp. BRH_c52]|nr:MAG: hypothetical protein APF83_04805 [Lutibacter sp. BRH_c52]